MSEQNLNLNLRDDWEEIKEKFRDHFGERNIEIEREKIKYNRSGEHLEIKSSGEVSGAMPLHETEFSDAKKIDFRDSSIKISGDKKSYIFRR